MRAKDRKRAVIGAVGLVAVLGAGGIVAQQLHDGQDVTTSAEPGPVTSAGSSAPGTSAAGPGDPVTPSASGTHASSPAEPPVASRTAVTKPKTKAERVKASQGKAAKSAKNGTQVKRPLPRSAAAAMIDPGDVTVKESGSLPEEGRTLKVAWARKDLTGYDELNWVADEGEPVGSSHCTQKIRLTAGAAPRVRPTLLICWRTSATRSVYTVLVDTRKSPSRQDSVAAIDKQWAKLG